ncbi:hypothetical protein K432DRAFT_224143 [Lepidopterella palustris CBS 459.81]|uniref:Secreted protein n=1 Tax=Lepidopterella palustris CBS 459.81 TaxID=1314670 RepID=A0A8E2J9I7_9PEZI|nr:hypothetical protein K432DRAFT_224143 [Lepidopterella palustris CBS 459.81]
MHCIIRTLLPLILSIPSTFQMLTHARICSAVARHTTNSPSSLWKSLRWGGECYVGYVGLYCGIRHKFCMLSMRCRGALQRHQNKIHQ